LCCPLAEASVAKYDEELTAHSIKFNVIGQQDFPGGLRYAQVVSGYVTMIMSKSGLRG
jgi:hypothetical protein